VRTLFENAECVILYDDHTFHLDKSEATRVTAYIGFTRLSSLHEMWIYKPATKRFYAYKNRGFINEAIAQMAKHGIRLRVFGASIDRGTTTELCFEDTKDEFLFKLMFGA